MTRCRNGGRSYCTDGRLFVRPAFVGANRGEMAKEGRTTAPLGRLGLIVKTKKSAVLGKLFNGKYVFYFNDELPYPSCNPILPTAKVNNMVK